MAICFILVVCVALASLTVHAPVWAQEDRVIQHLLGIGDATSGAANELRRQWWEEDFQTHPLVVQLGSRSGEERVRWMKKYRRFVPGDNLQQVLGKNRSAFERHAPIKYRQDVQLSMWEGLDRMVVIADENYLTGAGAEQEASAELQVPLEAIQSAFRQGKYELQVFRAEYRSAELAELCVQLEKLFGVPVSAEISFLPLDYATPILSSAADRFLVAFDGRFQLDLYKPVIELPSRHLEVPVRPATGEDEPPFLTVTLKEGDVVYVPRGWGVRATTRRTFGIFVDISVHVYESMVVDALTQMLEDIMMPLGQDFETYFDTGDNEASASDDDEASTPHLRRASHFPDARSRDSSRKVLEQAIRKSDPHLTWARLLDSVLRVTADVMPDLRVFTPRRPEMQALLGWNVKTRVAQVLRSICEAAEYAPLLEPILEVLAEVPPDSSGVFGGVHMVRFGLEMTNLPVLPEALASGFKIALKHFEKAADPELAYLRLQDIHETEFINKYLSKRVRDLEHFLKAHKEPIPNSVNDEL
ncbi:hypothetical protein FVE85_5333 [Porphyridium purpureum]|uniref:Uncharacterized protein n=1 Tax=Porphyridium purpureum TaxID=35688 RepID=A0A5J4Z3C1_PORPP|nr:hypothetical protein FVE85_5333 [Porphyridium purpureum]|eukprot:POR6642..scf295_1